MVVIFSLWDKFQTNPTITGLDTDFHNWDVPFPTVTLCPEQPGSVEKIKKLLKITDEVMTPKQEEEIDFYVDLSKLSIRTIPKFVKKHEKNLFQMPNVSRDIRKLVFELAKPCEDIFYNCEFRAAPIKCCHGDISFYYLLTENGLCYAFNSRYVERDYLGDVQLNMQYIKETDTKWALEFSVSSEEVLTPVSYLILITLL
ncbi:uncharacterized protein LOC126734645 [Anthonomus grandis grandis]|uniref:uncharacterized protein LOC126734645 n=1 Tax=Anthonomus grandis grandis TaxID=2921223 RepID=UPI00216590EC|nr:uncharacterized protein LOC126734645 [Anthonomus grandis grandis]